MTRFHIAAALTTATVALLITFHLISTLGLPELDFLHLRYDNADTKVSSHQIAINPISVAKEPSGRQTQYLLGVGKADITGYGMKRPKSVD